MKVPAGSLNCTLHFFAPGFIGAHPTISHMKGWFHPITLDLCAAKFALYHRGGDLYPVSLQYQVDRGAGPKWPGDWCFRGWCFRGVDILAVSLILFAFFLIFNLVIKPLHFKLFHVGCLFCRIFREVRSVHSCSRYVALKIRMTICVGF